MFKLGLKILVVFFYFWSPYIVWIFFKITSIRKQISFWTPKSTGGIHFPFDTVPLRGSQKNWNWRNRRSNSHIYGKWIILVGFQNPWNTLNIHMIRICPAMVIVFLALLRPIGRIEISTELPKNSQNSQKWPYLHAYCSQYYSTELDVVLHVCWFIAYIRPLGRTTHNIEY